MWKNFDDGIPMIISSRHVQRNILSFLEFLAWEINKIHPNSKEEVSRDIGHKMSMVRNTRKSNFGSQHWLRIYVSFIMTLYYKMRQILLQNVRCILLQNTTVITKCDYFITKWDVYYRMCRYNVKGIQWMYLWQIAVLKRFYHSLNLVDFRCCP